MGICIVDEVALREPRLLVPGMQPLGPVRVDVDNPVFKKARFLDVIDMRKTPKHLYGLTGGFTLTNVAPAIKQGGQGQQISNKISVDGSMTAYKDARSFLAIGWVGGSNYAQWGIWTPQRFIMVPSWNTFALADDQFGVSFDGANYHRTAAEGIYDCSRKCTVAVSLQSTGTAVAACDGRLLSWSANPTVNPTAVPTADFGIGEPGGTTWGTDAFYEMFCVSNNSWSPELCIELTRNPYQLLTVA